jgi:hypothetical protein
MSSVKTLRLDFQLLGTRLAYIRIGPASMELIMDNTAPLYSVFLHYGPSSADEGLARLKAELGRLFSRRHVTVVAVENCWTGDVEIEIDETTTRIAGDNRTREFTGYERGLSSILERYNPRDDAVIVFANDTFHRNYGDKYLAWIRKKDIARVRSSGAILGHLDAFPMAVQLGAFEFQSWIRTSFWITRMDTAKLLVPYAFEEDVTTGSVEPFFKDSASISENYRDYLRTWLFGEDRRPDYPHVWHSAKPLTLETLPAMRQKLMCILSEHTLTARARELGVPIIKIQPTLLCWTGWKRTLEARLAGKVRQRRAQVSGAGASAR